MAAQAGFYVSGPETNVEFYHCTQVSGAGQAAQRFAESHRLADGEPVVVMVPSMDGHFISAAIFFRVQHMITVSASWEPS